MEKKTVYVKTDVRHSTHGVIPVGKEVAITYVKEVKDVYVLDEKQVEELEEAVHHIKTYLPENWQNESWAKILNKHFGQ